MMTAASAFAFAAEHTVATPTNHPATDAHLSSTAWTPRLVRCKHCNALAQSVTRERVDEDDVVVRYVCPECAHGQTRHYHDSDFVNAAALSANAHRN